MAVRKLNIFASQKDKPKSRTLFKLHWICWKILGIALNTFKDHHVYFLYSLLLNVMVTICYPLHLALALLRSDSIADNIKNLAVCITCVACSMKFIIYASKLPAIFQFERMLAIIDERVTNKIEIDYFERLRNRLRNIGIVFLCFYLPVGVTAELSFIFRKERSLLYPAWFPFNWLQSTSLFILANVYQIVGIFFSLLQNYVDDTFPPMALCVLSGHIEILSIRVANIGYDDKTLQENEEQLNRCIQDQQALYELYTKIEDIISWPIFIQFCVSATNSCLGIAALVYFASAPLDVLYYFCYCLSMQLQMFPTCYYGSDFQYQFDRLHRSVYASNWSNQTPAYKKHMILFTERSLKQNVALAGRMLRIHLDTFFATCRGAYSLLAVVTTLK